MPGKVNPVIPMSLVQVGCAVTGNDTAIAMAAQQGLLEINPYEPLIAARLFESLHLLTGAVRLFADQCIAGLEADDARSLDHLLTSSAVATILVPRLGYARVGELVRASLRQRRSFIELAESEGLLAAGEALALIRASVAGGLPGRPSSPADSGHGCQPASLYENEAS
ncbi:hypothetical protein CCP1ISM_5500002 [Azospirillaceae bacterium]